MKPVVAEICFKIIKGVGLSEILLLFTVCIRSSALL